MWIRSRTFVARLNEAGNFRSWALSSWQPQHGEEVFGGVREGIPLSLALACWSAFLEQCPRLLRFSFWVVLFFSSLLFVPCLLSWSPFLMLTITIFLSWNPSHSLYVLSNPYAVPSIITRQGILFAYLFLVMDDYSSSWFSCISCVLLLLILFSMIFHDVLFLLSGTFYLVPPCTFAYSADLFWSI